MSKYEDESEATGPTRDTATKNGSVVTVSSSVSEGAGCLLTACAFAIVLWALLTFGVPLAKYTFGG